MLAKTSIALAILIALSSGALAAHKRHDGAANAYARAPSIDERYSRSPSIGGRDSRSRSIDDLCRQTGPITMPATTISMNRAMLFASCSPERP